MNRNILWVLVAAVVAAGCETSSCDQNPASPSGAAPFIIHPPEISVPVGTTLREGDPITVTISTSGGTGSSAIAFVLVREDGATMKVNCGPRENGATSSRGTESVSFQGSKYEWAKGHILNGAILEAHFGDRWEAFREHGCYFLDASQNPFTVHFERATKRTDVPLNWRVE